MKSACTVNRGETYDRAEETCRKHNMELFIIDSANTQKALTEAMKVTLVDHKNGHVWINGKAQRNDMQWFTYGPQKVKLFDEVDWFDTECLLFKGNNGVYKPKATNCGTGGWFICEYYDER